MRVRLFLARLQERDEPQTSKESDVQNEGNAKGPVRYSLHERLLDLRIEAYFAKVLLFDQVHQCYDGLVRKRPLCSKIDNRGITL